MEEKDRKALYGALKTILSEYEGQFKVYESPGKCSLYTTKLVAVNGKPPEEMYFAGIRELKNIVGFYFMPIYCNPALREKVPSSLSKVLKGHTCFNIKKLTPEMSADLHSLIKLGIAGYKKLNWL